MVGTPPPPPPTGRQRSIFPGWSAFITLSTCLCQPNSSNLILYYAIAMSCKRRGRKSFIYLTSASMMPFGDPLVICYHHKLSCYTVAPLGPDPWHTYLHTLSTYTGLLGAPPATKREDLAYLLGLLLFTGWGRWRQS